MDRVGGKHGADELGAPGANQPRDPQYFPAVQDQVDIVERSESTQSPHLEHRLPAWTKLTRARLLDLLPYHHPDQADSVDLGHPTRADEFPVLQHAHAIGDLKDLLEAVGDIDDRGAAFAQSANDGEQLLALVPVEGRGGFVHDENIGVTGQSLGRLDHLPLGWAQTIDQRSNIDTLIQLPEHLARLTRHAPIVEHSDAR